MDNLALANKETERLRSGRQSYVNLNLQIRFQKPATANSQTLWLIAFDDGKFSKK
jgi:hypothetical protein